MRIIRTLLWLLIRLFWLSGVVAAVVPVQATTLTVGAATGVPGSAVSLPLTVSDVSSQADLFFEVDFNSAVLHLNGVTAGPALSGGTLDWNGQGPGKAMIVVYLPSCKALPLEKAQVDPKALIDLELTIDPAAPNGKSAVTLVDAASANTVTTQGGTPATINGEVTVRAGVLPPLAIPTLGGGGLGLLAGLLFIVGALGLRRRSGRGEWLVMVILLVCLGAQRAVAGTLPGDANNDGKVDSKDAALISDFLVDKLTTLPGNGDCNGDSTVDIRDVACVEAAVCSLTGNSPPVLSSIGNQTVLSGRLLDVQAQASDPNTGDTLTFGLSKAPVGMSVDPATGSLVWVPRDNQTGLHDVTLSVHDQHGASDSKSFSVDVKALGHPPVIQPIADQTLRLGQSLNLTAVASDPDAGDTLTFSLGLAPAAMTIDASTGVIAWTPGSGDLGAHDVTVGVKDSTGLTDFTSFTVNVVQVNEAPVAVNDQYDVPGGLPLSVVAPGVMSNDSDPNGDVITASLVSNPSYGAVNLKPDGSFTYQRTPGTTEPKQLYVIGNNTGNSYFFNSNTPLVADLDGDGVPELIFVSGFYCGSHLVAFHGNDGSPYFDTPSDCSAPNANDWIIPDGGALAVGDLNGDGKPEILAIDGYAGGGGDSFRDHFYAFDHTGQYLWTSQDIVADNPLVSSSTGFGYLTLADLDGDGKPEILVGYKGTLASNSQGKQFVTVFNHDGTIRWTAYGNNAESGGQYTAPVHVADLNLDGKPEVLFGEDVYDADGNHLWSAGVGNVNTVAVVNLNDDPYPEIVYKNGDGVFYAYDHNGNKIWGPIGAPGAFGGYIGSFVVGDVNGNGWPDLVGRNYDQLSALDRNGNLLWKKTSGTGTSVPTVFDLNGDGHPEVIYTDAGGNLTIVNGATGATLYTIQTIGSDAGGEQVVADVNGDGTADIVEANSSGIYSPALAVYGAASGAWMPSRPIWNQIDYHITNVNPDGTIPAHELPNWLQPGLNNYRVNVPLPGEEGTTDSFTYKVSDGSLDSNVATVSLPVKNADNPPEIVSSPVTQATVSVPYEYGLLARDPDVGDSLTYALDAGDPAGMSIDANGIVRWTPTEADLGDHTIGLQVSDKAGHITHQVYTLTVAAPVSVPNVVGETQANAESTLTGAGFAVGSISQATDPTAPSGSIAVQQPAAGAAAAAGSPVDLVVSLGPGPEDIDADHDGFTPRQGDCNDHNPTIHPGATDIPGDGVDQNCDGSDSTLPLASIALTPSSLTLFAGESVDLSAYGVAADGTSWKVGALATWSSSSGAASVDASGRVTAVSAGDATITASYQGQDGTTSVHVLAAVPGDATPPTAALTTPTDGQTVYGPVDITGTASDDNFVRYELAISPADQQNFTLLSTGTTPVANGTLGQLDPTLMLNGLYTLRLTVYDAGGNQASAETTVQLAGDQKVGNFTLSFIDLSIPMAGIPIEVARTYDSRDERQGDFGVGWRLGLKTLAMICTHSLGTGWQVVKSGLAYDLVATRLHRCTLTLPSGRVEAFDFVPDPSTSILQQFSLLRGKFVPESGTLGTLSSLDNMNFEILDPQPGPVELRDDITGNVFDPQSFVYTTVGRTQYTLSLAAGLEKIQDPNGNTLTIGPNGITHSSGKSVTFTRDAEGRIVKITDPAGHSQTYTYSAAGDLAAYTDASGNTTRFFYNRTHGLVRVEDPLGRPIARNDYDAQGRLVSSTDASGRTIQYTYNVSGRKETITDADGSVTTFEYDSHGNVIRTVDPLGGVSTATYDADGNQTATTNPLGGTTVRTFDAHDNVLTVTNPLGAVTRFTYDSKDRLTRVTDALGFATTFAYDSRGNVTRATDATGAVTDNTYDSLGQLVATKDPLGNVKTFAYDASGAPIRITDYSGAQTTFSYDADEHLVSLTDARGHTFTAARDPRGLLVAKTDALGNRVTFEYNSEKVLDRYTDPLGESITRTIDAEKRPTQLTDALGHTTQFTYSPVGDLSQVVDALGRKTVFAHDALHRLVKITSADGTDRQIVYDAAGRVVKQIDANGDVAEFQYDATGHRTAVIDALGHETQLSYDAAGDLVKTIDALGQVTRREYDALGHVTRVDFPDGTSRSFTYDADGRRVTVTDELGRTTRFRYDGEGRLLEVVDAAGGATSYAYDGVGNRILQTDADGATTRFEYDADNRLIRTVFPDGSVATRTYDTLGRLVASTNAEGDSVHFSYDADGHITQRSLSGGGTSTLSYTATGKVATISDAAGTTTYTYDALDRPVRIDKPQGSLVYSYDPSGDLASLTTVENGVSRAVTYGWDALRRISTVTDGSGGVTSYDYDALGRLQQLDRPNGVMTNFSYDTRGRLIDAAHASAHGLLAEFSYTRDAVGDVVRVDELGGQSAQYSYDPLRRIVRETHLNASGAATADLSYTYDAVGDRLSRLDQLTGVKTAYSYDAAHHLLTAGGVTYSWDAAGRLVSRAESGGTTQFTWNAENRLVGINSPTGSTAYKYDYFGNLVSIDGPDGARELLVDGANPSGLTQTLEEINGTTGAQVDSYVYGDRLISQLQGRARSFFHGDGVTGIRMLTNDTGTATDAYSYLAFGEPIEDQGATVNPFRFAGERLTNAANLVYMRARFYDPLVGRFISPDPFRGAASNPITLQSYLYGWDDPLTFHDPTGRFTLADIQLTASIIGIIGSSASVTYGIVKGVEARSWAIGFFTTLKGLEYTALADAAISSGMLIASPAALTELFTNIGLYGVGASSYAFMTQLARVLAGGTNYAFMRRLDEAIAAGPEAELELLQANRALSRLVALAEELTPSAVRLITKTIEDSFYRGELYLNAGTEGHVIVRVFTEQQIVLYKLLNYVFESAGHGAPLPLEQ